MPQLSATARQLTARWREQSLLDSTGAEEVLAELESELKRIEPKIDSLLDRQREIVALLRSLRSRRTTPKRGEQQQPARNDPPTREPHRDTH
jgi:hypothetical protein